MSPLLSTIDRWSISLWMCALLCFASVAVTHSEIIFTEDYEVPTIYDLQSKGWGTSAIACANPLPPTCSADLVSAPVRSGSKALRMTYQGSDHTDATNAKIEKPFRLVPEIYGRYYYRTEPIPPATQSSYGPGSAKQHYIYTTGGLSFVSNHYFGDRRLNMVVQGAADCDGSAGCSQQIPNVASVPLLDGKWYCIEYHIKLNTPGVADGVSEIWVDGVLTARWSGRMYRNGGNANAVFNEIFVYRQDSRNMYRYEDDFVIATHRIGCDGVIPPESPIIGSIRTNTTVLGQYTDTLKASGGKTPYFWSIVTGNLPAGLSLTGNVISGKPTTMGSSTFTAKVTDATGATATKSFTIIVSKGTGIAESRLAVNGLRLKVEPRGGSVVFQASHASPYSMGIYDLSGREVWQHAGSGDAIWNHGRNLKKGVYLVRVKQNGTMMNSVYCNMR